MVMRVLLIGVVVGIGVVLSRVRISAWGPHAWWVALLLMLPEFLAGIHRSIRPPKDPDEK